MKLQLYPPLKKVLITQHFGENPGFYADPKFGGIIGHNGLDLAAHHGDPVYASHDGLASFQIDSGGGHGVVIITNGLFEEVDGTQNYFKTIYWHLCDSLKEPQFASPFQDKTGFTPVKCGDLIGYADNTGASTGDHLHFGLKTVALGEAWGTYYNTNQHNGYNGAIDPEPYLTEKPIVFKEEMKFGQYSEDIQIMQAFFLRTGYMKPIPEDEFGWYGYKTSSAIKKFMLDQGTLSWWEKIYWGGKNTGPKTLRALNEKYK